MKTGYPTRLVNAMPNPYEMLLKSKSLSQNRRKKRKTPLNASCRKKRVNK